MSPELVRQHLSLTPYTADCTASEVHYNIGDRVVHCI